MSPHSSIWSPFDGHWETALTSVEWQARFAGPLPPTCTAWLGPGARAVIVPCPHADGCGQPHRVHRLSDRKTWLAVPEAPDCESTPLTEEAIATHTLDLPRLAHAFAHALRLDSVAIERLPGAPAFFRLGHTGKAHLPIFFSTASSPVATSRAAASAALLHAGAFILLVPLASHLPSAVRATLRDRQGALIALDEILDLDARGQLIALKPLSTLLPALATAKPAAVPRLLVPPGTTWREIHLKIINGKILVASFGSQTAQATAEQLNQVPRDDPESFRPGWETLVAFVAKGVLAGDEKRLFPKPNDFKNRRAEVRAILRDFINIEDDPIRDLRKVVPDAANLIRKGDRTQRKLRRGFSLIARVELVTGVDKRAGNLPEFTTDDPDSADSYPHRTRQNSDES